MRRVALAALASAVICAIAVADAPQSNQAQTATILTGFIDPTVATYNGNKPMRCTANTAPSAAFLEQNRATLQQALADASAQGKNIYLPRCTVDALNGNAPCPMDDSCGYSWTRKGTGSATVANCGVETNGISNVTLFGYGAVIRGVNATAADLQVLCIRGATNIRILGVHFSGRDITGDNEQNHLIRIGDGLTTANENIEIADCLFEEMRPDDTNHHGDCIFANGNTGLINRRVTIVDSTFDHCNRTGIAWQSGHSFANMIGNTFVGTRNSDIDNEGTHASPIEYESIIGNHFERGSAAAQSSSVSISGFSDNFPQRGIVVADNDMIGGRIEGVQIAQAQIRDNNILINGIGDTNQAMFLESELSDTWVVNNYLRRTSATAQQDVLHVGLSASCILLRPEMPLCYPPGIWIRGNSIEQDFSTSANTANGIGLGLNSLTWVTGNDVLYTGSGNSTSTVGFNAIYDEMQTSDASLFMSGWVAENSLRTTGGQPLSLWYQQIQTQNPAKLGTWWVRDNRVSGARTLANLSISISPETYPEGERVLISGNVLVNTAKTGANDLKTWRSDNGTPSQTLTAAGAISPSTLVTYINDVGCGSPSFTLPACTQDGMQKHIKVYSSCTSSGTLTPTGFGDGTTITWTVNNTTPNAAVDLACDKAGGKWWRMAITNMTVNP